MTFHVYWDASALVKRYAPESGTPLVNRIFADIPLARMMSLILAVGEVVSIFVRKRNAGPYPRSGVLSSPGRLPR
ncbi:MAG: hypothetical protein KatS3mg131_2249 [Candidatus Tectimicrobiota bacterium]|nr:MAG: hypothetical protein KatS3mg131_2249 [Candidatus Tectomicrobia bacterium]